MKKIIIMLITAGVIGAAAIAVPGRKKKTEIPVEPPVDASTERLRESYFASHGWEVEEISGKDIIIPSEFSEGYERYAAIQDKQGMPLREYAGREGQIYVYEVKNYSPDNRKMLAELLVCDNTAIASLVYSDNGDDLRLSVK